MKVSHELELIIRICNLQSDGTVLYDLASNKVLYVNKAGTAMTGLLQGHGKRDIIELWKQVLIPDRAYVSSQYEAVLKQGQSHNAEFGLLHNGKEKQLHALACAVHEQSLLVVFLRDITQLKEHEDYLVEFGARKNTLLDMLTHNLSGSLNMTRQLMLQAERHSHNSNPELKTVLGLIGENNRASLKIIEDFLNTEHEVSPKTYVKRTRIDVVEKIGYVYQQLRHSFPDRIFHLTPSRPEIHITTDEVKLLQVVNNLVSNAVKFSEVTDPVEMSITAISDGVVISITDYGIGIPESLKPIVFQYQPNTGRAGLRGEPSNGKGLAICKHLVNMIEGTIWFESTEHSGTTFFIRLPYVLTEQE